MKVLGIHQQTKQAEACLCGAGIVAGAVHAEPPSPGPDPVCVAMACYTQAAWLSVLNVPTLESSWSRGWIPLLLALF